MTIIISDSEGFFQIPNTNTFEKCLKQFKGYYDKNLIRQRGKKPYPPRKRENGKFI